MLAFIDSNVAVYAMSADDELKHERAADLLAALLGNRSAVVSTQVLQEAFNVLTRKKRLPADDVLGFMSMLSRARVMPCDTAFVLRGLRLGVDHRLSVWDGFIVQAALDAGCGLLYSEDLQSGRRFGDLEVINPFDPSVHEPKAPYKPAPRPAEAARRGRRGPASRR